VPHGAVSLASTAAWNSAYRCPYSAPPVQGGGTDEPGTETPTIGDDSRKTDDRGLGPAPPETVALWVKLVAAMGPDELHDFEERTFRQWDRTSLDDLRRAIERRRRELAG
jgi:hypothetical protein